MKKMLPILAVAILLLTTAAPVLADPTDYNKKADKGIYYLVAKDEEAGWAVLPRSSSPFGKGKFSIKNGTLTMRLTAHKLTPGNWYYVELAEKNEDCDWIDEIGEDEKKVRAQFYGQADSGGNVHMTFSWDLGGKSYVEVNMKNADWVALFEPSDLGDSDEWIYTGQGWGYVLYGATTIPDHCSYK